MAVHKQNRGGSEVLDNKNLIQEIRLCIIGDFNSKLFNDFPNGIGEIEFDVRGGHLQKNIQIRKVSLMEEDVSNVSFSRKGLEVLLKLLEARLLKWKPLDYGKIHLQLILGENGELEDVFIAVRVEQHFKRF
ncbi:hypothetical protein [Paenibacillus sp. Y412MC10]|uniref:hypothetical protein n=1 Tax=Geobacillus sp. (strain Y412MC10) TaxID=481743 RepID=UPI0011AB4C1D|nr:hypothetical protein [Paenibacillus sp. Y412MC10]